MVGRTKLYVKFEPSDDIFVDVSSDDIEQAIGKLSVAEFVRVDEVGFTPSELGDKHPTVTVVFKIDRDSFESESSVGYNGLVAMMKECVISVVGGEFVRSFVEGGW